MENLKPIFRIFFSSSHSTPRRLRCHSLRGVLLLTERMNVRAYNLYARFAPLCEQQRNMKLAIWTFPYCKESLCDWIWSTWAEFICHIRSHHAKNNDKNFTRAFFSRSNFKPYKAHCHQIGSFQGKQSNNIYWQPSSLWDRNKHEYCV